MNEQDYRVVENMEKYGGSFVKALAELARRADARNLALIKKTWTEYWDGYTDKELKSHDIDPL